MCFPSTAVVSEPRFQLWLGYCGLYYHYPSGRNRFILQNSGCHCSALVSLMVAAFDARLQLYLPLLTQNHSRPISFLEVLTSH